MNIKITGYAVIVANGRIADYKKVRTNIMSCSSKDALVLSVDGGIENTVKLALKPDIVIGDMDSIDRKRYRKELSSAQVISVHPEKDESDTQLAAQYALDMGIKDITFAGVCGGRLDHTFANIMLLASPDMEKADVRIVTEDSQAFVMDRSGTVKGKPGRLISIFSITPHTSFVRTTGLKYELKDERLEQSPARGLSNVFTSEEAALEFTGGKVLIIKEI